MSLSFFSPLSKSHEAKTTPSTPSASSATAKQKRDHFAKTLAEEFKREILYAHAVDLKRAPQRDPFITQVVKKMKDIMSVVPAEGVIGSIGKVLSAAGTVAATAAEKKRDERLSLVANLVNKLDFPRLDILLSSVARSAVCRYQLFLDRLSDNLDEGATPLARIGAQRILEYVSRQDEAMKKQNNGLLLTEAIMLTGLIEGNSGSGVDGFVNSKLKLKSSGPQDLKTISAECVYGRPGFQLFEIKNGKVQEELYTRDITFKEKAKKLTGKSQPYSKKRVKVKRFEHDPKAGFVVMPKVAIEEYKFQLLAEKKGTQYEFKTSKILSQSLQDELNKASTNRGILVIDLETLKLFLTWSKSNGKQNILKYLDIVHHLPHVELVRCQEDLTTCDLDQANLSHMDFGGSKLGGKDKKFNEIDFSNSYLVNVIIEPGTTFHKTKFHKTHCELFEAEQVIFTESIFTQTNFSFAKLNKARFVECTILGVIWHEAEIEGIEDQAIIKARREQTEQLIAQMEKLQLEILAFRQEISVVQHTITREIKEMKVQLEGKQEHQWTDAELKDMLPKLTAALQKNYQRLSHVPQLFSTRAQPISDVSLTIVERHKKLTDTSEKAPDKEEVKENKEPTKTKEEKKPIRHQSSHLDTTVIQSEQLINPEDIFTKRPDDESKEAPCKIVIFGHPGMGKSTSSDWIAYRSMNSLWPDRFDFVFRVKLRKLTLCKPEDLKNLARIIRWACCLDESEEENKLLEALIEYVLRKVNDRCLFVLDGADEVAKSIGSEGYGIENFLQAVFKSKYVIVTTRPHETQKIKHLMEQTTDAKQIRQLETVGFTDEQVNKYILQSFPKDQKGEELAKSLQEFLQTNPRIKVIAHIPIYLSLICFAWEKYSKNKQLFSDKINITELYQIITHCFLEQFLWDKKDKSPKYQDTESIFHDEDCKKEMYFLQFLAFHAFQKGSIEFGHDEVQVAIKRTEPYFQSTFDYEQALKIGFLKTSNDETDKPEHRKYYFFHSSCMEFLAARYLKNCLMQDPKTEHFQEAIRFVYRYRFTQRFQHVFSFLSGLVSLDHSTQVPLLHSGIRFCHHRLILPA